MTNVLEEDLAAICEASYIPWESLAGCRVLVTGATGLIGGLVVRALCFASQQRNLGMRVAALVRSLERASSLPDEAERIVADVTNPLCIDGTLDYIVHAASETASMNFVTRPVETIRTTFDGTRNILELAVAKKTKGVLYVSSMEMYGTLDDHSVEVTETDCGYIDTMSVRSSYPEGKRMAEVLCRAYVSEYGVLVKVARLVQTFGPGTSKSDNRVFSQFARAVMERRPIVLKTDGSKAHCYCYTTDAVTGLLTILLKGMPGAAYNVSNEDTFMTIREMAEMLSNNIVFELSDDIYPPSSKMKVLSGKLRALGWYPTVGLKKMYERLILWMCQSM